MLKIKRRKYLVKKDTQFRYMGLVLIPLVLLLACLYYLMYYAVFYQMLIPEAVISTLLPAMKQVNIVLMLCMPVLLFLLIYAGLVYSNRLIGPIPRLEREIDRIIAGDYSVRLKTRDKDDLRQFVNKINIVLEKLSKAS
ncbi:MAG: methyl-accepting chemotaxis protein [Candidatus Omnitrophota bacterium]